MAVRYMESGSDATQDFVFYGSTTGTVASDTAQSVTGPRSIKISTGAGPTLSFVTTPNSVVADAGGRFACAFRVSALPAAGVAIIRFQTTGGTNRAQLALDNTGILTFTPSGATAAVGTKVIAINTWYYAVISYFITNTTTFTFKTYVDHVLDSTASAGTMSGVSISQVRLGWSSGASAGTNRDIWFDDVFSDDGASSGSQPDLIASYRITAKRPFANGTTNAFTTQIGSGGSGYGSGHAPQVNEQPLSVTNGWSIATTGGLLVEEYNVEGRSIGDVDISRSQIFGRCGWVYAKTSSGTDGTVSVILNGATTSITLTTTNTFFSGFDASSSYVNGTGNDVGIQTSAAAGVTDSLFECGVLIAFAFSPYNQNPIPNPANSDNIPKNFTQSTPLKLIGQDSMIPATLREQVSQPLPPGVPGSFTDNLRLNLDGKDFLPARNRDFPPPHGTILNPGTHLDSFKQTFGNDALPASRNRDFPNPKSPILVPETFIDTLKLNLQNLDFFPFRQNDWVTPKFLEPLPTQDFLNLLSGGTLAVVMPFSFHEWKLPVSNLNTIQFLNANEMNLLLNPPTPPVPGTPQIIILTNGRVAFRLHGIIYQLIS